jgi:hypothetical protein
MCWPPEAESSSLSSSPLQFSFSVVMFQIAFVDVFFGGWGNIRFFLVDDKVVGDGWLYLSWCRPQKSSSVAIMTSKRANCESAGRMSILWNYREPDRRYVEQEELRPRSFRGDDCT